MAEWFIFRLLTAQRGNDWISRAWVKQWRQKFSAAHRPLHPAAASNKISQLNEAKWASRSPRWRHRWCMKIERLEPHRLHQHSWGHTPSVWVCMLLCCIHPTHLHCNIHTLWCIYKFFCEIISCSCSGVSSLLHSYRHKCLCIMHKINSYLAADESWSRCHGYLLEWRSGLFLFHCHADIKD